MESPVTLELLYPTGYRSDRPQQGASKELKGTDAVQQFSVVFMERIALATHQMVRLDFMCPWPFPGI